MINLLDWSGTLPAPCQPVCGEQSSVLWPTIGRASVVATSGNQVQTFGIIGEQDDRMMFDTPMGLV